MILFTISNTFAAKLFATKLSKMSCLFSHSLLNILAHLPPQYNCFEKCRGSWKNWRPGICYSNPIPVLIPVCEIANSGMGRELKKSIPTIREREGNEKNPFPQFGNGKGMKKTHSHNSGTGREWKKSIPEIREREGNEKIHSHNSGRESEAFILGNGREREFLLTPARIPPEPASRFSCLLGACKREYLAKNFKFVSLMAFSSE